MAQTIDYNKENARPSGKVQLVAGVRIQRMIYSGQRLSKRGYVEDDELQGFWACSIESYSWDVDASSEVEAAQIAMEKLEQADAVKAASMRKAVRASARTMTVHNATGKEVRFWSYDEHGERSERILPPERFQSGVTTRVVESEVVAGFKRFSIEAKTNPFPPERESVIYIVDQVTKTVLSERKDLFVVIGPEEQEDGRVVYKGIR